MPFDRLRIRDLVLLGAGVAVGALIVVGPSAGAKTNPKPKTVVNHLSLDASAFVPDGLHDTTQDYFNSWDPQTLTNNDVGRCFDAPVALPTNATMKRITFYYSAGTASMYVELNRQNLAAHTDLILTTFSTATAVSPTYTASTRGIPAASAVVNNLTYAYSIGVCPTANTSFTGVDITFTTTS